MNRIMSVIRRRPNLVDMLLPKLADVHTYRLKWAANFDGSFTTFIDSTRIGFYDDSIPRGKVELQPTQEQVRIVFDPATYSIPDTAHIWLQLWTLSGGDPEAQQSASTLLLPDTSNHGVGIVTIHGTAPSGMSSADSQQLDLPRLMTDYRIHNEEIGTDLYVATEQDGPESTCPGVAGGPQFYTFNATQGSIWVRGGGATAAFSAVCTLAFPR